MKYDGKWFGDHLGDFSIDQFKKEVDSTFSGDPKKGKKIAELFALFQLRKTTDKSGVENTDNNGDNTRSTSQV
ncbi:hypothetical protein [Puia sp.]|jgi:hypothetical protein|uniref:hypothetical protein n=1 Tax=Puia sp. TaxID=2045100 RepID=UPI002F4127AD